MSQLPLEGIRILDMTIWQQGTYATTMLADMGADVIKIESEGNPDPGRAPREDGGRNWYFHSLNRGKRSLILDLKTEAGQTVFWKLVETADESLVVIRFANPRGIDFPYLTSMIGDSWMSRANSIVIPGGKLDLAMQLILTPYIHRLVERRRRAS